MTRADDLDVLAASAADGGDPAVVDLESRRTWTYAELSEAVDERAAGLGGSDVCPLVIPSDVEGLLSLLAVWRAGRVAAPINPALTPGEQAAATNALAVRVPVGAQAILWTSGSSGSARGVVLGARGLRAITDASVERLGVGRDDVWGLTLSPAHVGGLAAVVRAVLLGGTIVVPKDRSIEALAQMLSERHPEAAPTRLSLVPTQLRRLYERGIEPSARLRSVLVGGAHAPVDLVRRCTAAGWPLALTYGATETTSQVATATPAETRADPGHVGRPMPGVDVRVAPDGELLVRGPTTALGRVGGGRPGGVEAVVDAAGWVHTGDIGALDASGYLRVTGRRIDRIVTGGVTVEAVEVEDALRTVDGVRDACVVGVSDEEWGERVAAWIDVESGVDPGAGPDDFRSVLETSIRDRLSSAKRPRLWHFGGALPRSVNGKVDRNAVRRACETGHREER